MMTLTGACGVGDDDGGPKGEPLPPLDNKELCQASFQLSGTFTPGTTPRPTDPDTGAPLTGCWPIGTWTFTATVTDNKCAARPTVLPSYSFVVARAPDPNDPTATDTIQTMMSTTSVGSLQYHLAMSSNGQGCEGSFELGSADGKDYWNMKPTLPKDVGATAITGAGDYVEYDGNAWPWKTM
jgi:hypothetical protein